MRGRRYEVESAGAASAGVSSPGVCLVKFIVRNDSRFMIAE